MKKYRLLNNGLAAFTSESGSDVHLQMAAATLTVIPILIIYLILEKRLLKEWQKMASKAKTTVTFHSGILTIGGTVIEVAYKDAHIFFDFGSEYHPEQPLPDEALQTLVDHRWVPQLRNVYDPRLSYTYHGSEQKDYQETAVFYLMPILIIQRWSIIWTLQSLCIP